MNYQEPSVVESIVRQADGEQLWAEERVEVPDGFEGPPMLFNFLNVALWKPQIIFEVIREEHSEGEEVCGEYGPQSRHYTVAAPNPMLREDKYDVARPLGYMRAVNEMGCALLGTQPFREKLFSFIDVLSSPHWEYAGVNPLCNGVHEFYGRVGPVRVETPDREPQKDAQESRSAADASW